MFRSQGIPNTYRISNDSRRRISNCNESDLGSKISLNGTPLVHFDLTLQDTINSNSISLPQRIRLCNTYHERRRTRNFLLRSPAKSYRRLPRCRPIPSLRISKTRPHPTRL